VQKSDKLGFTVRIDVRVRVGTSRRLLGYYESDRLTVTDTTQRRHSE